MLIDPVTLVSSTSRLFIDTNVFMDTDPRRQGGLKALFADLVGSDTRGVMGGVYGSRSPRIRSANH